MRLLYVLTILLFSGLSMSCNTLKKNTKNEESKKVKLTDTYWKLLDINGKAISDKLNKVPFIQFDEKEKKVSGTNGCNIFFGSYDLNSKNEIKFVQMTSTLMACLNNDNIESNLNLLMSSEAEYTIKDSILTIQNTKTKIIARFIEVENASLNGTWTLTSLGTAKASLDNIFPDKKPQLTFDVNKERLIGYGGCNQINTRIQTSGNAINFGPIASTRMACSGDGEAIFLKALASANRFSISKDKKTLILIRGDIVIMSFERTN